MKRIETISAFLTERTDKGLASLFTPNMEVQVNVARDGGEPIEGSYLGKNWKGWTDSLTTWKGFRIPRNTKTTPEYTDVEVNWNFKEHVEAIGMTGWDWVHRVSNYVAFDFDSITNHSKGLTQVEMAEIIRVASGIKYLTVRRSTSGLGIHFYVFFAKPVPTDTHTEHAALARSVLNKLSTQFDLDFSSKVDVCGGVMWVWHRKYETAKAAGLSPFELLSSGEELYDVPSNWRDHIPVIKRQRAKVQRPETIESTASQYNRLGLDNAHRRLLEYLGERGIWDADHNMLTTHTALLAKARTDLELLGEFDTIATGKEQVDYNCFAFPLPKGAWVVRRYSLGCTEHPFWSLDSSGWTRCFLNRRPDFDTACRAYGGIESKKGVEFQTAPQASSALHMLGLNEIIPERCNDRTVRLSVEKVPGSITSKIMVEIERTPGEKSEGEFKNFIARPKFWERTVTVVLGNEDVEVTNYDDIVRHTISESDDCIGWLINVEGMGWIKEPLENARLLFQGKGYSPKEISQLLGSCTAKPWRIVSRPFESEYPGDRQWNRNAPQLKYIPLDIDEPEHPTWDKILEHLGTSLTPYLKENIWAKENNVLTGADYLMLWMASVIRQPKMPLPYLFFHGAQLSGKSTYHEAFDELITGGVERATLALQDKFNSEIGGAVVCVIEELDLSERKDIYNKIKDYVTSQKIQIRPMYQSPYMITNTTHWIQVANDVKSCPTFPGDTRVTYIHVGGIEDLVPRMELFARLREEAPAFLCRLMKIEIPKSKDRLGLPVIETVDKVQAMSMNGSDLDAFLTDTLDTLPGNIIPFADVYDKYVVWCGENSCHLESKIRVSQQWPQDRFPKGPGRGNILSVGNAAFKTRNKELDKTSETVCMLNTRGALISVRLRPAVETLVP